MPYEHPEGGMIGSFNSHKEHLFFEKTTKRQLMLIVSQMAELLKEDNEDWIDKATRERDLLKLQGIK